MCGPCTWLPRAQMLDDDEDDIEDISYADFSNHGPLNNVNHRFYD